MLQWRTRESRSTRLPLPACVAQDLYGHVPGETGRGSTRVGVCETSAGNEGGWVSQARLRSGGMLTKVMRHGDLACMASRRTDSGALLSRDE